MNIRGVHIDLKTQRMAFPVLEDTLRHVSGLGFNTILLEYQDNFPYQGELARFAGADALTLCEVERLKQLCAGLGMEIIPMVQSIGHMYWVTRHPDCAPLGEAYREVGRGSHSLCPSHPESFSLFQKLAQQVMQLHPESRYFHIGGDEVHFSSLCPACAGKDRGILLGNYYRKVLEYTREQGFIPAMWGDMVLKYENVRDFIPRDTLIFDWDYMNGLSHAHGEMVYGTETPPVPYDDNSFARTRLLREQGFPVVTAPAVRSMGDTAFLGRNVHPDNCMQACLEAMDTGSAGIVITSWAVRLVPWPLTELCFTAVSELMKNPRCGIRHIRSTFCRQVFGTDSEELMEALLHFSEKAYIAQKNADFLASGMNYMDPETGAFLPQPLKYRLEGLRLENNRELAEIYTRMADAAKHFLAMLDTHCPRKEGTELWRWAAHCGTFYGRLFAGLCTHRKDKAWLTAQLSALESFAETCRQTLKPYLTLHSLTTDLRARVTAYTDYLHHLLQQAEA